MGGHRHFLIINDVMKKKECTMYKFVGTAFKSWVLMAALAMPLSGVLASCSSDDDDTPSIEESKGNDYLLINGDKWYSWETSAYTNLFYSSDLLSDVTTIAVVLSSEEWDMNHYFYFSYVLDGLLNPANLSKGQILNSDGVLQGSGTIILNNKRYSLEWTSGNFVFQSYDSQKQKVKLSFDDVVLQNVSQDATYKVKGDIEIDYMEYYYNV